VSVEIAPKNIRLADKISIFGRNLAKPPKIRRRRGAWHKISARRLAAAAQGSSVCVLYADKTRKSEICECIANCNLKAARRRGSLSGLCWPILYCACAVRVNCYFRDSDRNYDIAIRYSKTDFLQGSNDLAMGRRFHSVTLTCGIRPWTFVIHRVSRRDRTL